MNKLKIRQEREDLTGFVNYTINTPLGRTMIALIYLAFRMAKANKKGITTEVRWNTEIKERYNKILREGALEGFALLGLYMRTLYYMDKEWVITKTEEFESMKGSKAIEAFMEGYLSGERVSDTLYKLMRPYYLYCIDYSFRDKNAGERLMHHIAIGYLRGHEDIGDTTSLIRKVLDQWNPEQLPAVIDFMWMQRNYLNASIAEHEAIRERIIDFWRWIYENKYREKGGEVSTEDKNILAHLSRLTVFIDRIDSEEKFNWLILSARHVDVEFVSPFFIEYLDRFEDEESIRKVGKIFLEMLSTFTPDFDKEHIRSIVKKLYRLQDKDDANKICDIYGREVHEFLRDIYEENNPSI